MSNLNVCRNIDGISLIDCMHKKWHLFLTERLKGIYLLLVL
jgi:hypothetical protein